MIVIITSKDRRLQWNTAPDDGVAGNSRSRPDYLSRQRELMGLGVGGVRKKRTATIS